MRVVLLGARGGQTGGARFGCPGRQPRRLQPARNQPARLIAAHACCQRRPPRRPQVLTGHACASLVLSVEPRTTQLGTVVHAGSLVRSSRSVRLRSPGSHDASTAFRTSSFTSSGDAPSTSMRVAYSVVRSVSNILG